MRARTFVRGGIATILVASAFSVLPLGAYSSGQSTACTGCHGSATPRPSVTIGGLPAFIVANQTSPVSVTVALSSGQITEGTFAEAGFYLFANSTGGELTTGDNGITVSGLVATHNTPKALSSNRAVFNLTYRAPTSPLQTNSGTVTFGAWGNSVNGNNASTGDRPNQANSVAVSICFDQDGDGAYSTNSGPACPGERDCNDAPGDGEDEGPEFDEICDGEDNDCDGSTDEGCNDDPDDYCDASMEKEVGVVVAACPATAASASQGDDCDDTNGAIRPGASEICDGVDNNCNGSTDEACNGDGDDYCAAGKTVVGTPAVCSAGGGDCDDGDGTVYPGAEELCNDKLENCLSTKDFGCNDDGDDYCDAEMTVVGTPPICPEGGGDCDDENGQTYPDAPELCDGEDNDCDSEEDEEIGSLTCGVGACQQAASGCVNGVPQSCTPLPAGTETCANTGTDDDCDGIIAELTDGVFAGDPCTVGGASGSCRAGVYGCVNSTLTCQAPAPEAETCANQGVDNDCDGNASELADGIFFGDPCSVLGGQGRCATGTYSCDGNNLICQPDFVPGEIEETCSNIGVDDDCDGDSTEIADGIHSGEACETGLSGLCAEGTASCAGLDLICIESIAPGSQLEVCDGVDNDCDGGVDNKTPQLSCGVGECFHFVEACSGGKDNTCTPLEPSEEICDNLDNDCDQIVDEGCDDDNDGYCDAAMGFAGEPATCELGGGDCDDEWANTYPDAPERCDGRDNDCDDAVDDNVSIFSCGVGDCENEQGSTCVDGEVEGCTPAQGSAEVCDAADNDCDGLIDDDLALSTCGKGTCANTGSSCFAESCTPREVAEEELCDGIDNDCDGFADEVDELPLSVCGVGECQRTGRTCDPATCSAGLPLGEICDGLDNNCNGVVDDGLPNSRCGIGECASVGSNCLPSSCQPGTPADGETCDGLDNDCDGKVDEGCDDDNDGYCNASLDFVDSPLCENGPGDCRDDDADTYPGAKELCDGNDNDCNGLIDDEIGAGDVFCGKGACIAQGTTCSNGEAQSCDPGPISSETCDGIDNDCNGLIDDGLGETTCGLGQCRVSISSCTNGKTRDCEALMPLPEVEICDGLDNDCDGTTDEPPELDDDGNAETPLCEQGVCVGGQCVELDGQGGASGIIDYSGLADDPELWLNDLGGAGSDLPDKPKDEDPDDSMEEGPEGSAPPDEKGGCNVRGPYTPSDPSFSWYYLLVGLLIHLRRRKRSAS